MMAENERSSRIKAILDLYENAVLEASDDALAEENQIDSVAEEARLVVAAALARKKHGSDLLRIPNARRRARRTVVNRVAAPPRSSRQEGLRATFAKNSRPLDEDDENGEE